MASFVLRIGFVNRTNSLLLAVTVVLCACDADIGEYEGLVEEPFVSANFVSANFVSANALTANFDANEVMTRVPLATESYDAAAGVLELQLQLHDELTRGFFEYLVSCALDSSQVVEWKDPFDGNTYAWPGAIALCPEWGKSGTGKADDMCQELVSACLLSRVNAFGIRVPFSMRGHDRVDALPLAPSVPGDTRYSTNAEIPSFQDCGGPTLGAVRECSWYPGQVGICTANTPVTVGAGAPEPGGCGGASLGGATDDAILRVCAGIVGCQQADPTFRGQADDSCGDMYPSVTFVCPASGFYNVMYGHKDSTRPVDVNVQANAGDFGIPEEKVFDFREGGFFGNIFDTDGLQVDIFVDRNGEVQGRRHNPVKGSVYKNMFACWSDAWSNASAYYTQRVCAGPVDENCAADSIGACTAPAPGSPGFPSNVCGSDDGNPVFGDHDYQECRDPGGRIWEHALTPILNRPCDLAPYQPFCKRGGRKPPRQPGR